ncbi:MAG: amino acid permease, partial [Pyrinomonadaceae bacterium]
AGLFVLRRRDVNGAHYMTPGYPATPLIFLALIALLLFLIGAHNPLQAATGLAVVLLGLPVYLLFFRARQNLHSP